MLGLRVYRFSTLWESAFGDDDDTEVFTEPFGAVCNQIGV